MCVLVTRVHNFGDTCLHYHLGTLIAREQRYIDSAVLDIGAVLVENGIQLGVTYYSQTFNMPSL